MVSLLVIVGLFEAVGLGVFLAFLLGWIYAGDGTITLDMQQFGEAYLEYWLMLGLVPVLTLALFYALEALPSVEEDSNRFK